MDIYELIYYTYILINKILEPGSSFVKEITILYPSNIP